MCPPYGTFRIGATNTLVFAKIYRYFAFMVETRVHPLVRDAPGGLCWRRSERRRAGRAAEAHRELVVLMGLSDRAQYLIDGSVVPLRRGTVLFALAGQSHVLLSDTSRFDMWVFLISDRILDAERRADPSFPPLHIADRGPVAPRHLREGPMTELEGIAQAARHAGPLEARDALRYWLARAWAHWRAAQDATLATVHPAVDRAAHLIRRSPEMSLEDVAGRVGLSAGRLSKLFGAQTGQGFAAFRAECRLSRVEELLRDRPDLPLMTAALDAGYGSYAQFYRDHVTRTGRPPREMRTQ